MNVVYLMPVLVNSLEFVTVSKTRNNLRSLIRLCNYYVIRKLTILTLAFSCFITLFYVYIIILTYNLIFLFICAGESVFCNNRVLYKIVSQFCSNSEQ
jgi:hypothetical protein